MSGGLKRSSRFGIIGIIVVMVASAAIGLTLGDGQADPKLALGLIFGVIAVYCVILFALQRTDLNRVSGADARDSSRAAAEGGRGIKNPTTMSDPDLWAAMAIGPIDAEAVKARAAGWEAGRQSQSLAMLVTLLIVIAAVWGSVRALMPRPATR